MFTGIIQEKVALIATEWAADGASCRLCLESAHAQRQLWRVGDSLAVDGTCLTIIELDHRERSTLISFDVSRETLEKTHWSDSIRSEHPRLRSLHLEPALRFGDALGGHMVSGHVEGLAILESRKPHAEYLELTFSVPRSDQISSFLVAKGSVAIDGVSLTLNHVWDVRASATGKTFFSVFLIPHTLEKCHFGLLQEGDSVNIESDLIARHFCRYQENRL